MLVYTYKCVIVGDSNVGKTSIIKNLIGEKFDINEYCTIGVNFYTKTFKNIFQNDTTKLRLWDVGGKFGNIIECYKRNCNVLIIVYDVTNRESFDNILDWKNKLFVENNVLVIIGNKTDLKDDRKVSKNEGKQLNCDIFREISAKNATDIKYLFSDIREMIKSKNYDNILIEEEKNLCF